MTAPVTTTNPRPDDPPYGMAVVPRPAVGVSTLLRPVATAPEVLALQEETRTLLAGILKEGRDYGLIPGIDKPSLLKPGAERVAIAFGCAFSFAIVEREIDHDREVPWLKRKKVWRQGQWAGDWSEESGTSFGLYRYVVRCDVIHRDTAALIASCLASCSTMESKYVDRPRDSENTVLKMAEKRAQVGAVLLAFGLSEQFTQDVEETAGGAPSASDDPDAPKASDPKPDCPVCGGAMWDNRMGKKNPKAPDYRCKDKSCDGKLWPGQWPPKKAEPEEATTEGAPAAPAPARSGVLFPYSPHEGVALDARHAATDGQLGLYVIADKWLTLALKRARMVLAEADQPGAKAAAERLIAALEDEMERRRAETDAVKEAIAPGLAKASAPATPPTLPTPTAATTPKREKGEQLLNDVADDLPF